jgi:hypothetical protein
MRVERRVPPVGLLSMEIASKRKYEEFAAECERLAKEARTEPHRAVLREMAHAWRKLAEAAAATDG